MPTEKDCRISHVDKALEQLSQTTPKIKEQFIRVCVHTVFADGSIVAKEVEIIRAIADVLDCPMPPMMVG